MQPYDAGRNGIGWVPERAVVECVVRFRPHGTGSVLGRGQGRFLQPLTCSCLLQSTLDVANGR
jgi:hypothetical protein